MSLPSIQTEMLLTLGSELALLLVARGESEMLVVLLFVGPDLILYIEEAGILFTSGCRLPCMLRLISCIRHSPIKFNNCLLDTRIALNYDLTFGR